MSDRNRRQVVWLRNFASPAALKGAFLGHLQQQLLQGDSVVTAKVDGARNFPLADFRGGVGNEFEDLFFGREGNALSRFLRLFRGHADDFLRPGFLGRFGLEAFSAKSTSASSIVMVAGSRSFGSVALTRLCFT